MYACEIPCGTVTDPGFTAIETSTGASTVSTLDPCSAASVAWIVVLPAAIVVASPAALMVALAVLEELHKTTLVRSTVPPPVR